MSSRIPHVVAEFSTTDHEPHKAAHEFTWVARISHFTINVCDELWRMYGMQGTEASMLDRTDIWHSM